MRELGLSTAALNTMTAARLATVITKRMGEDDPACRTASTADKHSTEMAGDGPTQTLVGNGPIQILLEGNQAVANNLRDLGDDRAYISVTYSDRSRQGSRGSPSKLKHFTHGQGKAPKRWSDIQWAKTALHMHLPEVYSTLSDQGSAIYGDFSSFFRDPLVQQWMLEAEIDTTTSHRIGFGYTGNGKLVDVQISHRRMYDAINQTTPHKRVKRRLLEPLRKTNNCATPLLVVAYNLSADVRRQLLLLTESDRSAALQHQLLHESIPGIIYADLAPLHLAAAREDKILKRLHRTLRQRWVIADDILTMSEQILGNLQHAKDNMRTSRDETVRLRAGDTRRTHVDKAAKANARPREKLHKRQLDLMLLEAQQSVNNAEHQWYTLNTINENIKSRQQLAERQQDDLREGRCQAWNAWLLDTGVDTDFCQTPSRPVYLPTDYTDTAAPTFTESKKDPSLPRNAWSPNRTGPVGQQDSIASPWEFCQHHQCTNRFTPVQNGDRAARLCSRCRIHDPRFESYRCIECTPAWRNDLPQRRWGEGPSSSSSQSSTGGSSNWGSRSRNPSSGGFSSTSGVNHWGNPQISSQGSSANRSDKRNTGKSRTNNTNPKKCTTRKRPRSHSDRTLIVDGGGHPSPTAHGKRIYGADRSNQTITFQEVPPFELPDADIRFNEMLERHLRQLGLTMSDPQAGMFILPDRQPARLNTIRASSFKALVAAVGANTPPGAWLYDTGAMVSITSDHKAYSTKLTPDKGLTIKFADDSPMTGNHKGHGGVRLDLEECMTKIVRSEGLPKVYCCPGSQYNIIAQSDWLATGGKYFVPQDADLLIIVNDKHVTVPKGKHCLVSASGHVYELHSSGGDGLLWLCPVKPQAMPTVHFKGDVTPKDPKINSSNDADNGKLVASIVQDEVASPALQNLLKSAGLRIASASPEETLSAARKCILLYNYTSPVIKMTMPLPGIPMTENTTRFVQAAWLRWSIMELLSPVADRATEHFLRTAPLKWIQSMATTSTTVGGKAVAPKMSVADAAALVSDVRAATRECMQNSESQGKLAMEKLVTAAKEHAREQRKAGVCENINIHLRRLAIATNSEEQLTPGGGIQKSIEKGLTLICSRGAVPAEQCNGKCRCFDCDMDDMQHTVNCACCGQCGLTIYAPTSMVRAGDNTRIVDSFDLSPTTTSPALGCTETDNYDQPEDIS